MPRWLIALASLSINAGATATATAPATEPRSAAPERHVSAVSAAGAQDTAKVLPLHPSAAVEPSLAGPAASE